MKKGEKEQSHARVVSSGQAFVSSGEAFEPCTARGHRSVVAVVYVQGNMRMYMCVYVCNYVSITSEGRCICASLARLRVSMRPPSMYKPSAPRPKHISRIITTTTSIMSTDK